MDIIPMAMAMAMAEEGKEKDMEKVNLQTTIPITTTIIVKISNMGRMATLLKTGKTAPIKMLMIHLSFASSVVFLPTFLAIACCSRYCSSQISRNCVVYSFRIDPESAGTKILQKNSSNGKLWI
mmetsp:Transcript_56256/g.100193  ORF Transcript_56256/g.100193 Transcript_56256/m.100193 type:complete len:124 (-) Transcript_56256:187-558(-)